ncbi:MAG: peptide chain release factor N(5)-glutamine methyltransferase [Pseudomonadota bacterium]|jgi:release factor glutamine methyltransferase
MIRAALALATSRLKGLSESPRLDAEILLAHLYGWSRAQLITRDEQPLSAERASDYEQLLTRRGTGEPVAYLIGYRDFWTSRFAVGPGVLVPRPETELLVEIALEWLIDHPQPRLLDLGTGCGAIGLSIALARPEACVDLVERSAPALAMAATNRAGLGAKNARLLAGSWFAPIGEARYDVILANPPYIDPNDPHLAAPTLRHEPLEALVAEEAGLADLRWIAGQAPRHLLPGGRLLMEHGHDQGGAVRQMLKTAGFWSPGTYRDLAGRERATGGALGD